MPISRRSAIASTAALAFLPAVVLAADKKKSEEGMPESEPFGRFTVDQVARRLGQPNVHVYDGNSDETYHEAHVPGAVRLYSKTMKPTDLPAQKDATLIFYCHNLL
ncbi:MAG TPA: rhodanese-like domain-containing protein [Verrucomicrobiae bacterium]|nr:rhodanese-like domain-containing protein [Verrucomicrobiae bacterium]